MYCLPVDAASSSVAESSVVTVVKSTLGSQVEEEMEVVLDWRSCLVRDPRPYPVTCRTGGCADPGMSASRRLVSAMAPGSILSSLGLSYSEKMGDMADPAGGL